MERKDLLKLWKQRRKEMYDMRMKEISYGDIAKHFGVSRQFVHQCVTKYSQRCEIESASGHVEPTPHD